MKDNGKYYEEAQAHATEIGFDIIHYCGKENGFSFYYLSDSRKKGSFFGLPYILRFGEDGKMEVLIDALERLNAFYMYRDKRD